MTTAYGWYLNYNDEGFYSNFNSNLKDFSGSVFVVSRTDSQSNVRICGRACLPFGLALRVKSKMAPLFFEYEPILS